MKDQVDVFRVDERGQRDFFKGEVAVEFALTIVLNGKELVTLLCSPEDLQELVIGYLHSEGLIETKEEIKGVVLDERRGIARIWLKGKKDLAELPFKRVITSGCGRGASFRSALDIEGIKPVESSLSIEPADILHLTKEFQRCSEVYRATHGVHSASLCDTKQILIFKEDIGRHNALDKVFGKCLLEGIPTVDRIVITSGRISSEVLLKVARRDVPVVVSLSAPTDQAVGLAHDLRITLIGFARGKKMNVYAGGWRLDTR